MKIVFMQAAWKLEVLQKSKIIFRKGTLQAGCCVLLVFYCYWSILIYYNNKFYLTVES